jgi:hypothetical protein
MKMKGSASPLAYGLTQSKRSSNKKEEFGVQSLKYGS